MTSDILRILAQWPAAIPRRGSIVTSFGDTIPFEDYMLTRDLVLLIRAQPDAHGTRRVIMKVEDILAIRFADAIEAERFTAMGFQKNTAVERCTV